MPGPALTQRCPKSIESMINLSEFASVAKVWSFEEKEVK